MTLEHLCPEDSDSLTACQKTEAEYQHLDFEERRVRLGVTELCLRH